MHRAFVAASAVLVSVSSCTGATSSDGAGRITSAIIRGDHQPVRVAVEVADTPDERRQGLMGRTSLGANEGMVFLFTDGPVDSQFWMKDTLIPLSIAFWDEGGRIVGMQDMDPCPGDPCPTYASPEPYIGALEVNEGFFAENGVTIGDRIELVE